MTIPELGWRSAAAASTLLPRSGVVGTKPVAAVTTCSMKCSLPTAPTLPAFASSCHPLLEFAAFMRNFAVMLAYMSRVDRPKLCSVPPGTNAQG
jgi:hypothetical protein